MNINKFIAIARLTEEQLFQATYRYLTEIIGYEVFTDIDNLYMYAKGQSSVCLVAHLDTAFGHPPTQIYTGMFDGNVLTSPEGLGADDRAGVYAILEILGRGLRPSVIFTTGEESGGVGAFALTQDHPGYCPTGSNCLIELDRAGKHDSVYYECGNTDFEYFINSFGFKTKTGIFSDISILAPAWNIAAVNLSIGYFNQHSLHERLNCKYVDLTINKVIDIINSEPEYYDYQENINLAFYHRCFVCITGDCDNCSQLKTHKEQGGFDHGRKRQYSKRRARPNNY